MNSVPQINRLTAGGLVDRAQPLSFRFDGRTFRGYAGDTLASALLSAGVKLVGRSFKYHRPRGIVSAGSEEPNALVELRTGARREPNTRASTIELYDGLEAASQNRWPSLAFDLGEINSVLSPLFVAGFYYKTFMWPAPFWERVYEPLIRNAAGLGRAAHQPDPDHYEAAVAHCDVLIIGTGPAGLAAALMAGRAGARVVVCDEDFILGGRLNAETHLIDGVAGPAWSDEAVKELASFPNVKLMPRTTVFGVYDGCTYGAIERVADHRVTPREYEPRQRYWKIVARRSILAAGAIERPLVFGGNDRPGVMLASAVRTYVHRYAVAPGKNIALFTCNDDGWKTAEGLAAVGITLTVIIDTRELVDPSLLTKARKMGIQVLLGSRVVATKGRLGLSRIVVRDTNGRESAFAVDVLAVAGGWNPTLALTTHLGAKPAWSDDLGTFVPHNLPPGMVVAGAAAGNMSLSGALHQGTAAAQKIAADLGFSPGATVEYSCEDESSRGELVLQVEGSRGKSFVDFQHDVTCNDLAIAVREGYSSPELLKRYTTLGMATDQGKTSNVNSHALLAALTGRSIPQTGTTTFRPPYTPIAIGALAGIHRGAHFRPTRRTATHDWAAAQGAQFVEAGLWLRAQLFSRDGEKDWLQSASREAMTVRSKVGVCDVSTLGKIDVQGKDAARFLDGAYTNLMSSAPIGRARYGIMLREDGFILDDGTCARFGENHFVISTTTANAALVMQHLEHARQVIWPELDVHLTSVSDQWSQFSIAGPLSRKVLENLLDKVIDVSNTAFPFMACAQFMWGEVPARLFRISFSGELAYELAVPSRCGDAAIRAIMDAGAELGITPYGTEALSIMRIEKGHAAGGELNGTTTAADLGLGKMLSKKKDFIGRVLAQRPALIAEDRPRLVGVKPINPANRIAAGAHVLRVGAPAVLENDEGHLSSVAWSPTLNSWIGLALIKKGLSRQGEIVRAYDPVRVSDTEVEICSANFVDPEGVRLHA